MTSIHTRRSAGLVATLFAGAALACSDVSPTAMNAEARLSLSEKDAAALQVAIDDARGRVLPAFVADATRQQLVSSLETMTTALGSRDARAMRSALSHAEAALETIAPVSDSSASAGSRAEPELDVIRLVLDNARALLVPQ